MPTAPQPGPRQSPLTWTVVQQTQQSQRQPNGTFANGWTVTFQTGKGTQGSVFIPDNQYTPENVYQAIAAKVAIMAGVANLSG